MAGNHPIIAGKSAGAVFRPLLSVNFLLAAFILAAAAVGLRPGMLALSRHYAKEPIAIRRPLAEFDMSRLPSFRTGWEFARYGQPIEALGTDEFAYIGLKSTQVGKEPSYGDLVVTYYSSPQDKVPHVPDVCYRGQGALIRKIDQIVLECSGSGARNLRVPVRFVIFQWPEHNEVVMYCFCAEGRLRNNREQVRWVIGKPGNRYTYFSQIKAGVHYPLGGVPDEAVKMCRTLLCEALCVLLAEYFPDAEELRRR